MFWTENLQTHNHHEVFSLVMIKVLIEDSKFRSSSRSTSLLAPIVIFHYQYSYPDYILGFIFSLNLMLLSYTS